MTFPPELIMEHVQWILRADQAFRNRGKVHARSLAECCAGRYPIEGDSMFEVKIQTYWSDTDPAGIVFFPHYFRFVEQAEEEFYRTTGVSRIKLLEKHGIWLPRVE